MLSAFLEYIAASFMGSIYSIFRSQREAVSELNDMTAKFVPPSAPKEELDPGIRSSYQAILTAFEDVGFKGHVHVLMRPVDHLAEVTKAKETSYISKCKQHAFVEFNYNPEDLKNISRIYAIAGHEAIHVTHHHAWLKAAMQGAFLGMSYFAVYQMLIAEINIQKLPANCSASVLLMSLLKLFGHGMISFACSALAPRYIEPAFSRYLEKDADISSVKQLGTRDSLIAFFFDYKPYLRYPTYLKNVAQDQTSEILNECLNADEKLSTEEVIKELKNVPKNKLCLAQYGAKTYSSDTHPCALERILYLSALPSSNLRLFKSGSEMRRTKEEVAKLKDSSINFNFS